MNSQLQQSLINFLQEDLHIPADAIAVALRHPEPTPNLMPMILWQYGLITIEQVDEIFAWLETA